MKNSYFKVYRGVKWSYDSLFETESAHDPERFLIPLEVIWYCTKLHRLSDFQHHYKLKHSKIYLHEVMNSMQMLKKQQKIFQEV